MRLSFMGTPPFALPSLRALSEAGHEICLVVTQPDRPAGRGQRVTPPPVKLAAQELMLPVLQVEKVRESSVVAALQESRPEAIVVVAYGQFRAQASRRTRRTRGGGGRGVSQETRTAVNRGHLTSVFSGQLASALTPAPTAQSHSNDTAPNSGVPTLSCSARSASRCFPPARWPRRRRDGWSSTISRPPAPTGSLGDQDPSQSLVFTIVRLYRTPRRAEYLVTGIGTG